MRDITKDRICSLSETMFHESRFFPIIENNTDFTKVMMFVQRQFIFTFEQLSVLNLEFNQYKKGVEWTLVIYVKK